jgi:hypothetical protein
MKNDEQFCGSQVTAARFTFFPVCFRENCRLTQTSIFRSDISQQRGTRLELLVCAWDFEHLCPMPHQQYSNASV